MWPSQDARARAMSSSLSPGVLAQRAKDHGEPSWLADARQVAFESYRATAAPQWRRTDLSDLDVEALAARAADAKPGARTLARQPGLVHLPLAQAAREHPDLLRETLTAPVASHDKWARLHHALWSEGSLVFVEKGAALAEPIVLQDKHGPHGALVRDVIVLAPGAQAHVVARATGGGAGALSMDGLDVSLQPNSSLHLATLQDLDHRATLLSNRRVALQRDARLSWIDGQFGGARTVTLNETRLAGQGAALGFIGAFFGSKDQHYDVTTSAWHTAPHTSSQLNMKGALSDDGYAVNYSIVNIGPDARNSSGHQHQETLLLSDKARADAIPKLDVENNDVSASHGATVGQVDPDQVFYLLSRGLSGLAAKRLIVEGFFEPLLKEIPLEDVREEIRGAILARMK
jgi:Fe-S cluster assembly protein SufD